MPVTPQDISELDYDAKDLFLDVRLSSVSINDSNGRDESGFYKNLDFTGRPTFKSGFFRDSIGFGITNIKITTNASLQPTLDIEFKDLYGKTVFGELSGADNRGVSYKALFQWPPPKFEFTFKGYLGKPVTWILNMKTTSTQYNSDDGSYTIGASFVPNQWGMFADIPFLYLFAVKGLKSQFLGDKIKKNSEEYKKATENIIDYMYIGKKLEVAKKGVGKDYDAITGSLLAFKSDVVNAIITGQIPIASLASEGEVPKLIKSGVPGKGDLKDFQNLAIVLPDVYKDKTAEEIEVMLKDLPIRARAAENARIKAATFRSLKEGLFGNTKYIPGGVYATGVEGKYGDSKIESAVKKDSKDLDGIIDENLSIIDNAIKASIYENFEDELEKTTIKSIFGRTAKDAAYIMGFILDAGEQGYINNREVREELEKDNEIIGQYYPMQFIDITGPDPNDSSVISTVKKQVPVQDGLKTGAVDFEKLFVSNFITAISFGIAQNRSLQEAASSGQNDGIKFRVNNIEILSDNPFLNITDWKEIASIIMKRAGISGYITKSQDPNRPGYYPDLWWWSLNPEAMRKFADKDLANITDAILLGLEPESLESLKTFCIFWSSLIADTDGTTSGRGVTFNIGKWRGGASYLAGDGFDSINNQVFVKKIGNRQLLKTDLAKKIFDLLDDDNNGWSLDTRILGGGSIITSVIEILMASTGIIDTTKNAIDRTNPTYIDLNNSGFEAWTVEEYLEQFIGPNYLFFGRSTRQGYSISPDGKVVEPTRPTLKATASFYDTIAPFVNYNGLSFSHVDQSGSDDNMEFLWFRDEADVAKLAELQPVQGTSDAEDAGLEDEEKNENAVDAVPLGVNIIDSPTMIIDPEVAAEDTVGFWFPENNTQEAAGIKFWLSMPFLTHYLDYEWCKGANTLSDITDNKVTKAILGPYLGLDGQATRTYIAENQVIKSRMFPRWAPTQDKSFTSVLPSLPGDSKVFESINPTTNPMAYVVYGMSWKVPSGIANPAMSLFGTSVNANATRVFLRKFCVGLYAKIDGVQNETNEIFGRILGKAGEHEDLIYQQFHSLFHQWQILGSIGGKRINTSDIKALTPKAANELEKIYGGDGDDSDSECGESIADESNEVVNFRYDYPLQSSSVKKAINVGDSIINIESLYNAKANTTVLNIFQQVCTKNNFMFFPIPGNSRYKCVQDIFRPVTHVRNPKVGNFFQILFNPTPESRSLNSGDSEEPKSTKSDPRDFEVQAFPVKFGDPSNKIVRNVTVSTDDNKVTAESIVNLQKIVDNEDNSRTVTTDCSLLSVFEGRSYKAKIETIGNAQISPMQFFYLENHTIFTGLYQIIKVNHTITPNDMTTDFEGIKMRYAASSYGGILPITLDDFKSAAGIAKEAPFEVVAESEEDSKKRQEALSFTGKTYSPSQSNVVGTGKGAKTVAGYLKNKTTKRNIDDLIAEAIKAGITDARTIAGILSIVSKESSFILQFENINYSRERAYETWPRLRKIDTTKAFNPETFKSDTTQRRRELCKIVYGKTYGNDGYSGKPGEPNHKVSEKFTGPFTDGYDGYRYRGGGYNQITFKSNYIQVKEDTGIDVVLNPDSIILKGTAEKACIGFFKRRFEEFPQAKADEWNATNNKSPSVSFTSISDAVFYTYHCNTGLKKSVSFVKGLYDPSDVLGGMNKAQDRAPALLAYVEESLGLPASGDGLPDSGSGDSGGSGGSGDGKLPFTGPTPNADKLRKKLIELGYKEKGSEISNGGDISLDITNVMIEILKSIKEKYPSYSIRLTGGNDEYHQKLSYNSKHKTGYGMDFTVTPASEKDLDNIVAILESFKKKYKPAGKFIDEYRRLSSAGTGGHFHVQIN